VPRDGQAASGAAYGLKDVAGLLGLTERQIRGYVRAGFLAPARGSGGQLRFTFQDLVFLRLVKGLASSRVPPRRIHRALRRLREQLPPSQPLSGLRLDARGGDVVVRREGSLWHPGSGQSLFDFDAASPQDVVSLGRSDPEAKLELQMESADWYALGCELHDEDAEQARAAYERALALDPAHVDARVNLGCLHHAAGKLSEAEAHYRAALEVKPRDATAWFDLGVTLEDQGRHDEAGRAYERALESDPDCADAHYNLARILDRLGRTAEAVRHLRTYRRLTQDA
jgi:tetratricopeptide (TPR) repeat protein